MEQHSRTHTTSKRHPLMTFFALAGFTVVLILSVIGSITVVNTLPDTFASLANIVKSIDEYEPLEEITIETTTEVTSSGEQFTLSWNGTERDGTYGFTYDCTDGVAVDYKIASGEVRTLTCEETLPLTDTSLTLAVHSEKSRFVEVPYVLEFLTSDTPEETVETSGELTVINTDILEVPSDNTIPTISLPEDTDFTGETTKENTETESPDTTESVSPLPPTVVETVITEIPTSNPNGFVDFHLKFLGVGSLESQENFIPNGTLGTTDEQGAIRFEIQNIGDKTSLGWDFVVELPGSGRFESEQQLPLLPNERATFTLGFDTPNTPNNYPFSVSTETIGDINLQNNSFTWSVLVSE